MTSSQHYLPALDGLRAVSILLVLIAHGGFQRWVPGGLGVLIFFVISGFLITRQMIAEIETSGSLRLSRFYLRRFLRLAPALLVYIALFCPLLVWLGARVTTVHVLSALLYFANYYKIFIGYTPYNPLPIVWSLSVEEHYYLLFPFCMLIFRNRLTRLIPWLCAFVIAVPVWRIFLFHHCAGVMGFPCALPGEPRIDGTDAIFDCILYGSLLALLLRYQNAWVARKLMSPLAWAAAWAGLALSLALRDPLFRDTLRFSLQAISVSIMLAQLVHGLHPNIQRLLSYPVAVTIGRWSYALYLVHYGVAVAILSLTGSTRLADPADIASYFILSFLLAAACHAGVEKPMIALRRRFGSHQPG